MVMNTNDILRLAQLARIGVDHGELETLSQDINKIVDWVSILQAAPTQGLEPLTHPHEATNPLRADVVTETFQEVTFSNTEHHQNHFFLVPQVIQ